MPAQTYQTRRVEIQAIQWLGDNFQEIHDWSDGAFRRRRPGVGVDTLEGFMTANVTDYIIRGLAGEFYPCRVDVFHLKYQTLG